MLDELGVQDLGQQVRPRTAAGDRLEPRRRLGYGFAGPEGELVPHGLDHRAVREAEGEHAAQLIEHLKKPEMAQEAERLLADTFWLPEPLRTPGLPEADAVPPAASDDEAAGTADGDADAITALPAFLIDDEALAAPQAIAAE